MSDDDMPQVFTKKFDRKSNSGREKLNGFLDGEEPEETDRPRSWVMDLTPGEYKAALFTLYFSLSILISKLIIGNKDTLRSITTKIAQAKRRQEMAHAPLRLPLPPNMPMWLGETLFTIESTWRSVRLVILPVMWSCFFTFYTWFMIYKNIRNVPGVDTPTPLTPTRHQEANVGGSFYLDYCLPLAISFCGFLLMLYLSHL